MITKTNKVITIKIDTNQKSIEYFQYGIEELTEKFVDFVVTLFKLLNLEIFVETSDEFYEDDNG